jgi:hypothetical protein
MPHSQSETCGAVRAIIGAGSVEVGGGGGGGSAGGGGVGVSATEETSEAASMDSGKHDADDGSAESMTIRPSLLRDDNADFADSIAGSLLASKSAGDGNGGGGENDHDGDGDGGDNGIVTWFCMSLMNAPLKPPPVVA